MGNREKGYTSVSIPRSLAKEIDKLVGLYGYTSRAELVKEAIRRHLEEAKRAAGRSGDKRAPR